MSVAKMESSSSMNRSPPPSSVRPNARTRKAAICPRVTVPSGQKSVFCGGLHPRVIPSAAMASMAPSWMLPSSSVKLPPGGSPFASARPIPNMPSATRNTPTQSAADAPSHRLSMMASPWGRPPRSNPTQSESEEPEWRLEADSSVATASQAMPTRPGPVWSPMTAVHRQEPPLCRRAGGRSVTSVRCQS